MNGDAFVSHYSRLREYLGNFPASSKGRSSAKDKLSRLPPEQFYDVSTDLYDEINRRIEDNKDLPFLPVRTDLLPKRNQARQKMATLPAFRFKELASEVLFEIEKRFPHIVSDYNAKYGRMQEEPSSARSNPPTASSSRNRYDAGLSPGDPYSPSPPSSSTRYNNQPSKPLPYEPETRYGNMSSSSNSSSNNYSRRDPSTDRFGSRKSNDDARSDRSGPSSNDDMMRIRNDYEFKIAKLEKQIKDMELDISDFQKERKRQGDLADRLREAEDHIRRMKDRDMGSASRLADLEIELQKTMDSNGELLERVSKLQREKTSLEKEMDERRREMDHLKNEFDQVQDDISKIQKANATMAEERDSFRDENDMLRREIDELRNERDRLKKDNERLQSDYNLNSASSQTRVGDLENENYRLKGEIDRLKGDVDRLKTELVSANAAVTNASLSRPSASAAASRDRGPTGYDTPTTPRAETPASQSHKAGGLDAQVQAFEDIADEMLIKARKESPASLLESMKSVVLMCRGLIEQVETAERKGNIHSDDRRRLKTRQDRMSNTLSSLMAAAKEHAQSRGSLSTANRIDDLIEDLRIHFKDVVDLLRTIDVDIPAGPSDGHMGDANSPVSPGMVGVARKPANLESPRVGHKASPNEFSTHNSSGGNPISNMGAGSSNMNRMSMAGNRMSMGGNGESQDFIPMNLNDLKIFLEGQTDTIAHAIQDLLHGMRHPSTPGDELKGLIEEITALVDDIVFETNATFNDESMLWIRDAQRKKSEAKRVLSVLSDVRDRLSVLGEDIQVSPSSKSIKQRVANSSYEIAKHSKELLSLLESFSD